jgi:membrane protein DedA with SNARE-associated domain
MVFWRFFGYNTYMKTKYTPQQISRFHRFCDRHGLAFATIAEYNGAIKQFFSED